MSWCQYQIQLDKSINLTKQLNQRNPRLPLSEPVVNLLYVGGTEKKKKKTIFPALSINFPIFI